jgi:cobalamin 5'-phosphate synthase/cobalamin synthase
MRLGGFHPIEWLHACAAAFQFLTRIPVKIQLNYDERLFRRSVVFYPLAGAVIGLVLFLISLILKSVLPTAPLAVILLGIWIALTGGLHMDGLMDTADGVLSHRSRERMLEIMKDSRVGAMGVIVGCCQLLMKAALLYSLLEYASSWMVLLIVIPIWSRLFMVYAIARWPYAREGEGMGRLVATVSYKEAIPALLIAASLTIITLLASHTSIITTLFYTVLFATTTLVIGWFLARKMVSKLGGLTGDTYGALNELLETAWLLIVVMWGYSA